MSHLVPCPECNRHVRVTEAVCPFCALPLDLTGTPEPRLPRTRLSRAATLAFGATLASASALAACEGSTVAIYGAPAGSGNLEESGGASAGSAGSAGSATVQPAAGAPAAGGGGPAPVYGAPPIREDGGAGGTAGQAADGGASGEAGDASDGGNGGGSVPLYGAAP